MGHQFVVLWLGVYNTARLLHRLHSVPVFKLCIGQYSDSCLQYVGCTLCLMLWQHLNFFAQREVLGFCRHLLKARKLVQKQGDFACGCVLQALFSAQGLLDSDC